MYDYCILVEKNSAMRSFEKALGGNTGTVNGKSYIIVPARGHLLTFAEPHHMVDEALEEHFKSWQLNTMPWDLSKLQWKRVMGKDTKQALDRIHAAAKQSKAVVIATDVDPSGEGDLIAWEILDAIRYKGSVLRLHFLDESVKSITNAFTKLTDVSDKMKHGDYLKAEARSRFDFASMQYTRIASRVAQDGGYRVVSRQGRLKSVMVGRVYEQEQAIASYVKKPYFEVAFRDENGHVYKRTLTDEEVAAARFDTKAKAEQDKQVYNDSPIADPVVTRKSSPPPKLYDLASLSAILAKQGFASKLVLDTYQTMYQDGVLSYPRTEDKVISNEQFNEMLPIVDKIAALVGVDTALLTHRSARKTHVKDGGAHGANRPGMTVPASMKAIEAKYGKCGAVIYEYLAKNFLAMFGEDYVFDSVQAHLRNYPAFKTSFTIPVALNYKLIFDSEAQLQEDDDENDTASKGVGSVASPFVHEGVNPKPAKPTMIWLMKFLERYDVGTGATRTSTLTEISATNGLLTNKKGVLATTDSGKISAAIAKGTKIASVEATKQLFDEMKRVGKFERTIADVLRMIHEMVVHDKPIMLQNKDALQQLQLSKGAEKLAVNQKEKATITFNGVPSAISREWGGHRFTDDEVDTLAKGEAITFTFTKDGRELQVTGALAEQEYKGKSFIGFKPSSFHDPNRVEKEKFEATAPDGRNVSVTREWGGHRFTDEEVKALVNGETITFIIHKNGDDVTVKGSLAEQEYKGKTFIGFKADSFTGGKQMTSDKEKVTGVFAPLGKEISFNREWAGYRFSDDEAQRLLDGKTIVITYTSKGKKRTTDGSIKQQEFKGRKFYGFSPNFKN